MIKRVITEPIVFEEVPDSINAKSVDAAAEPKTHDVMYGVANGRIAPVQIWLCGEKRMVIILISVFIQFPCASPKF